MARITVEDCLENVSNRFELIHLAARRVRQLRKGAEPLVICKNTDVVTTLREIAAGRVYKAAREEQLPEPTTESQEASAEETPEEVPADTQEEEEGPREEPKGS